MLLGEHAVLHGRRALVCAINKRITVSVSRCPGKAVRIFSALGNYESPLGVLDDHPDFRFVIDAVRQYPLEQGIELKIESEFSSDIGFGSSAAVTVATHAVLMQMARRAVPAVCGRLGKASLPLEDIFKCSLATIHRVQGRGSGADVAASVFGGVVAYRADPLEINPLKISFPLTAVYSGSKMKTAKVIALVKMARAADPGRFEQIFDEMDVSVGNVISDSSMIGNMLIRNQLLMEELGLCNAALADIIQVFKNERVPAKISGSGLGDCAIGLGDFPVSGKYCIYPLTISVAGVI